MDLTYNAPGGNDAIYHIDMISLVSLAKALVTRMRLANFWRYF